MFPPELLTALLEGCPEGGAISLDEFAEIVAPFGLSADQIDALIGALESANRRIEAEPMALKDELRLVLTHARSFAKENGRRPSVDELATSANVPASVVRRALVFGRLMGR